MFDIMADFSKSENNVPLKKLLREYRDLGQGRKERPQKKKKPTKKKKPILTPMQWRATRFSTELKGKATPSEIRFKQKLSYFKFTVNFQKPFTDNKKHTYIADFYIPRYGLIIELDGGYHGTAQRREYDSKRDRWFYNHGYQVWRMTNEEAESLSVEDLSIRLSTYRVVLGDNISYRGEEQSRRSVQINPTPKRNSVKKTKPYRVKIKR